MIGFTYSYEGATPQAYYYQRNLLGDVIAIYNANGVKQAGYAYDAWGNCTITDSTNSDIANANAIRYRGYYFDVETGWYFLNARYYSPEWHRFISPDDTSYLDPESVNGLNLYCYCNNDPVNFVDPSGHDSEWLGYLASVLLIGFGIAFSATGFGGALGGILIGMGAGSLINGCVTEANGGSFWAGYAGGMISGAICGAGAGIGGMAFAKATKFAGALCLKYLSLGALESFVGGFAGNFLGTIYTDWYNSGFKSVNLNMPELLVTSTFMGTLNIIAGVGSGAASIVGELGKTSGIGANSQWAHRILSGSIAGATETLYDVTSYLYGFLN